MHSDPDPPPWWWLTRRECRDLGIGEDVRRTKDGFVFGDPKAPCRLELVARDERAPAKLGSASIRVWGDLEAAPVRAILGEAAKTLFARRGRGFDPASVPFESDTARVEAPPIGPTVITVPSRCDRACVFCGRSSEPVAKREIHGGDEEVERAIDAAAGDVLFTGDDALSHPRIIEFIARAAARKTGTIGLIGPAGEDLDEVRAALLAAAGLASFQSGLFGGDARAHDAIAGRAGAFLALVSATRVLRGCGVRVELVTPLVRPLLADLARIVERSRALTGNSPAFLSYAPDPVVGTAFDAIVPAFDELRDALDVLGPEAPSVDALPVCALPLSQRSDAPSRLERTDLGLPVYPDATCSPCAVRDRCPGVAETVLRATGGRGLVSLSVRKPGP